MFTIISRYTAQPKMISLLHPNSMRVVNRSGSGTLSITLFNGSTQVLSFSTLPPLNFSSNRWQRFEESYRKYKEQYPESENFSRFILKNVAYGLVTFGVGYSFNEYINAGKQIDEVSSAIENQLRENVYNFEKMSILHPQPSLYLTTYITEKDKEIHDKNYTELHQCIDYLKKCQERLKLLSFSSTLHRRRKKDLENRLEKEIAQLEMVKQFNEVLWLQKNRHYAKALKKNEIIIKELENLKEKNVSTLFDLPSALSAAYNAQAKLNACLAFFSNDPKELQKYREHSSVAYNKAIAILEGNEDRYHQDLAIVLCSKAYLKVDCNEPEEAILLQKRANILKSNDERILCGIGLAIHKKFEKQGKIVEKQIDPELDEAVGYFSRAIQLNNKVPNIYVSRGKLLLTLGDTEGALADFETALSLDDQHSEANLQKAFILVQRIECDKAETYFKKGILPIIDRRADIHRQQEKLAVLQQGSPCHLLEDGMFFMFSEVQKKQKKSEKFSCRNIVECHSQATHSSKSKGPRAS